MAIARVERPSQSIDLVFILPWRSSDLIFRQFRDWEQKKMRSDILMYDDISAGCSQCWQRVWWHDMPSLHSPYWHNAWQNDHLHTLPEKTVVCVIILHVLVNFSRTPQIISLNCFYIYASNPLNVLSPFYPPLSLREVVGPAGTGLKPA